ncbi:hypothetical protein MRB53_039906 [Persea americana]|nr:hypothetical protein MRB53_039906 [Persea americana]
MGTRFLATPQAQVAEGYRKEVVRAGDGGQTTVRSSVYDSLRGTTEWPLRYGGRGVTNRSWDDAHSRHGRQGEQKGCMRKRLQGETQAGDRKEESPHTLALQSEASRQFCQPARSQHRRANNARPF